MKIRILGSAAGGGFPQWNCHCNNCRRLRQGSVRAISRTQSSIAVSLDEERWVLINASPDIRQQIIQTPQLQSSHQQRDSGIHAVILVDSQIDHATGLLMLREGKTLNVYCTQPVYEDLYHHFPLFKMLSNYCGIHHCPIPLTNEQVFFVDGIASLSFKAISLNSKAPPYSPYRQKPIVGSNIGLVITDLKTKKTLFYAPGLGELNQSIHSHMSVSDCLLIDGTFWSDDEMQKMNVGHKSASDMGHLCLSGDNGILTTLKQLRKPRKILTHINNTNPILNEESLERKQLRHANVEVAFDGMEITL